MRVPNPSRKETRQAQDANKPIELHKLAFSGAGDEIELTTPTLARLCSTLSYARIAEISANRRAVLCTIGMNLTSPALRQFPGLAIGVKAPS